MTLRIAAFASCLILLASLSPSVPAAAPQAMLAVGTVTVTFLPAPCQVSAPASAVFQGTVAAAEIDAPGRLHLTSAAGVASYAIAMSPCFTGFGTLPLDGATVDCRNGVLSLTFSSLTTRIAFTAASSQCSPRIAFDAPTTGLTVAVATPGPGTAIAGCAGLVTVTFVDGSIATLPGADAGFGIPCDAANPPCRAYNALPVVATCVASILCCTPLFSTTVAATTLGCIGNTVMRVDVDDNGIDEFALPAYAVGAGPCPPPPPL